MHLCVMNFSGNVGKTTVAANLLKPRLGAELFSVESLNQDADADKVEASRLRAERFEALQSRVLTCDNAIVDVGASNVETFFEMLSRYRQSLDDYDFFIVPCVKERKQLADTVTTIEALRRLGVPEDRIQVVFNRVRERDDLQEAFEPLLGYLQQTGIPINLDAVLHFNEVFDEIKDYDMSLAEVIADSTDHRQLLRSETTDDGKALRIRRLMIKRLSISCCEDMDRAFQALFAPATAPAAATTA